MRIHSKQTKIKKIFAVTCRFVREHLRGIDSLKLTEITELTVFSSQIIVSCCLYRSHLTSEGLSSSQLHQSRPSMRAIPRTVQICQIIDYLPHFCVPQSISDDHCSLAGLHRAHRCELANAMQLPLLLDNLPKVLQS